MRTARELGGQEPGHHAAHSLLAVPVALEVEVLVQLPTQLQGGLKGPPTVGPGPGQGLWAQASACTVAPPLCSTGGLCTLSLTNLTVSCAEHLPVVSTCLQVEVQWGL